MYAKVFLVGRLGADPEMRYTNSGRGVTTINVACDQGYGERKKTLWTRVTCWCNNEGGGLGQVVADHLHKGDLVFVEGEPSVRAYMRGDEPTASFEVNAREVKFMTPKREGAGAGSRSNGRHDDAPDVDLDEIPF